MEGNNISDCQRIVIPKGVVDPDEVTIIEIPHHLKEVPVIVAHKTNKSAIQAPSEPKLCKNSLTSYFNEKYV